MWRISTSLILKISASRRISSQCGHEVDTVARCGAYPALSLVGDVKRHASGRIMAGQQADLPVERESVAHAGDIAG